MIAWRILSPARIGAMDAPCAIASPRVALARDHKRFIPEPEAAIFAQHVLRRLEIGAAADRFGETPVLDLRHIDRGVPGGKEGRGADAVADLGGERVHLVAEERTR